MKTAINLRLLGVLACCLIGQMMFAQSNELQVRQDEASVSLNTPNAQKYQIDIAGPDNYHSSFFVEGSEELTISPVKADGSAFADGSYTLSIVPTFEFTEEQQQDLLELREKNDQAAITAYVNANNLPTGFEIINYGFAIHNGQFVSPTKHEGDMPPPSMFGQRTDFTSPEAIYASINYMEVEALPQTMDLSLSADDQVFADDVIVQSSLCVGFDCVNGENFGSDTERLKENNLRIHFDDTSASASFPANDWRITVNDSSNGGQSYFAVEDATAGRIPFRIRAGAPANSLYVNASGNIGIGTDAPVVETHIADGDSPTLRLEQNGSAGFASQTWDVAGNETNFFVRDVTNGSKLPFKIKPGAPDNSLFVAADGDIGLGTQNPTEKLHLETGNVLIKAGNLDMTGLMTINGDARYFLNNRANYVGSDGSTTVLQVNALTNRVGIGKGNPDHLLELAADDAVKPGGGSWSAPSDRRLKTNIRDYEDGLAKVMAIRPVRYNYNGKQDMPTDKEFIGLIAQEVQEVAPYIVSSTDENEDGESYLFVDGSPLTYMLINAVQDQQKIIDAQDNRIEQLEAQLDEVAQLREQVAALAKMLEANATQESASQSDNVSRDRK